MEQLKHNGFFYYAFKLKCTFDQDVVNYFSFFKTHRAKIVFKTTVYTKDTNSRQYLVSWKENFVMKHNSV